MDVDEVSRVKRKAVDSDEKDSGGASGSEADDLRRCATRLERACDEFRRGAWESGKKFGEEVQAIQVELGIAVEKQFAYSSRLERVGEGRVTTGRENERQKVMAFALPGLAECPTTELKHWITCASYYPDEAIGSFAEIGRELQSEIGASRKMPGWDEFCAILRGEVLSSSTETRWSMPLHRQVAGSLEKIGFSTGDWDLTFSLGHPGIMYCPTEFNELPYVPPEDDILTPEQSDLLKRIKAYLDRDLPQRRKAYFDSGGLPPPDYDVPFDQDRHDMYMELIRMHEDVHDTHGVHSHSNELPF